jgi:hypothetical protein
MVEEENEWTPERWKKLAVGDYGHVTNSWKCLVIERVKLARYISPP